MSIMRRMSTRQATKRMTTLLTLLSFITACSPANLPDPTSTPPPLISAQEPTPTPSATLTISITSTQPACLAQPGRVDSGTVEAATPPQEYLIYLPPCYDEAVDQRYPVLYLLHGQTYAADQWIRLDAVETLDRLIRSGEAQPFIMVFPYDRYWYTESGSDFGERLVEALIPHVDETYRTLPDGDQRAIGGLSRGAGWAMRLGLSRWDLFGVIGLHSLAVFQGDGSRVESWLKAIPPNSHPAIYMDIGDNDPELGRAQQVEILLNSYAIPHEWHLYSGAHTEEYWSAHVQEYIAWYAGQWKDP